MDYTQIPSPAFLLHEKLLRKNLKLIKQVQEQAGVEIILAFKAFAMWKAFPIIQEYISGATASSLFEARLCVEEMKNLAHTYAPAYSPADFKNIAQCSKHIVFNSLTQYEQFYTQTLQEDHHISCGLRVNPEYSDVETELYNPSSPNSRLGILHENLPNELPEGVEGLHFHVLCESTAGSLEKTLEAFVERFGKYLSKIKWINLGGGHLMTHKNYDVEHLIKILKDFKEKHNIHIILEPGSAFVWETGVLISQVLDIVEGRELKTAILDVSFTAHMPDTLEMPYRPKIIGAKNPNEHSNHLYRLGGASCLAGDYLETYDFDKELKIGDLIILEDMIHYTMVKTSMFNGVNHPSIAMMKQNGKLEVFREFGYVDYKSRMA